MTDIDKNERKSETGLSSSYQSKAGHVLNYLREKLQYNEKVLDECSESTRNVILQKGHVYTPEGLDWREILELLKKLQQTEAFRNDDLMIEYYCLLLQEDILLHEIQEEKLRLQVSEKKSTLLHILDQILYKASCLMSSIQRDQCLMSPESLSVPTSNPKEFTRLVKEL